VSADGAADSAPGAGSGPPPGAGSGPPPDDGAVAGPAGRRIALAAVAAWVVAAVAAVGVIVVQGQGQPAVADRSHAAGIGRHHRSGQPVRAMLTITDVGNMNFGSSGTYPPGGPGALLAGVTRHLHSQLALASLETTLGSGGTTKCAVSPPTVSCYAFQAPGSYAAAVRGAGFAAVNLAGSHADDAGRLGLKQTNAALAAAHLRYTGRPQQTTYMVRGGVRIALLGFAPYHYARNQLSVSDAVAAVRQAAARAQLVIVFMHANGEGAGTRSDDPIAFAHAMVRAGADLVLGSGPHALRGMQWYHRRLIAYSMGNFAGYYSLGLSGPGAEGAILRLRLRASGLFVGGLIIPIRLVEPGMPLLDPARAAIGLLNSLSRSEFGPSAVRITPAGRILAPPGVRSPRQGSRRPRRK
jgi:hypothetical protein